MNHNPYEKYKNSLKDGNFLHIVLRMSENISTFVVDSH